ncbi:IclR family transcriptional regulator domain-containing protein [Halotalea alkalilenta]|uniref:IclR family transcriptional regulator domain-containing protein n=1 Tax=Halotalea alkalilenta TaxID=376489 RepID=UPI0006940653|nr:IclR family transcriptional regulator C-terminal domain-containing protein [Halotalea alkalilenta]
MSSDTQQPSLSGGEGGLSPDDRDFVTALASGLEVITAFDELHRSMTLSEVAERTGMNRARARRFLLTLHSLGYVVKRHRYFELAPKVLSLGYSFLSANDYLGAVQQALEEITEALGESSSLGVLDGDDVVYAARSASKQRLMAISLSVGTRLPAAATSMGRMLLACLDDESLDARLAGLELKTYTSNTITDRARLRERILEARGLGYCIVDQELDSGLRSLAVPLRTAGGRLLGAINLSTNASRVDMQTLTERFLPFLLERRDRLAAHLS